MIARPSFRAVMLILCSSSAVVVESADTDEPLVLRGRVIDTSGKPVSGVLLEIWSWAGETVLAQHRAFDASVEVRTDSEGRYQTPNVPDRNLWYQARVALPGREPAATLPAINPSISDKTEFDDLVVRRVTRISGRVEDRQGRGVAGAMVFQVGDLPQRVQATTAADGQFRLEGVLADPTFVFVTKPGFRFFGRLLDGDEDAVSLVLTRTDEPADAWHTLPVALPKDERVALARRVLEPCLTDADAKDEERSLPTLVVYAQVDPVGSLARLEKNPPKNAFIAGFLKRAAAKAFAGSDLDEALAVSETIDDPGFRSMCYLDVVDSLGDDQTARKLELLGQATVIIRDMKNPEMRVVQLGETAERLLDLGARDEATKLLHEGEKMAQELPLEGFGGYARGAFAEELGQIDLPAALELIEGLKDVYEFDRHHGNLAHELAAKEPSEAERVLNMLHGAKESNSIGPPHDLWGVRLCYRMAPVDLPRARRIADGMTDPYVKAQAYGVMAQSMAKQDTKVARELIERAFGALQQLVDARETAAPGGDGGPTSVEYSTGLFNASSVAGYLLPTVEAVDPTLVREYFWRAVSFRLPHLGDKQQVYKAKSSDAHLAMMLVRYNRDVPPAVFRPSPPYGGRDPGLAILMLIDPARAAATVQDQQDEIDTGARVQLAKLLVLEHDVLWRKLHAWLGLWSIDVEDLVEL